MGLEEIRDGVCQVYLDDRYWPVLVSTWLGPPSRTGAERYFEWAREQLERAATEGITTAWVVDALDAKRPDAVTRGLFADQASSLAELKQRHSLGYDTVVLSNPLVRGAATAVSWLSPKLHLRIAGELQAAFADSIAALGQRGTTLDPVELEAYRRPGSPGVRAS